MIFLLPDAHVNVVHLGTDNIVGPVCSFLFGSFVSPPDLKRTVSTRRALARAHSRRRHVVQGPQPLVVIGASARAEQVGVGNGTGGGEGEEKKRRCDDDDVEGEKDDERG